MSETQKPPGRGSPPSTPRWVKVFVIIFIVLILVVIVLHLMGFGFGGHGTGGAGGTLLGGLSGYTLLIEHSMQQL